MPPRSIQPDIRVQVYCSAEAPLSLSVRKCLTHLTRTCDKNHFSLKIIKNCLVEVSFIVVNITSFCRIVKDDCSNNTHDLTVEIHRFAYIDNQR